ncbi:MAG: precorrin-8X methylmutase [Oligoflexales bacterium]|nr:precorrin-8X methylmutase [Oligoflexales bacterium]
MDLINGNLLPEEIERLSFEIISRELGERKIDEDKAGIVKRVIHASADFDYADTLCFSENVVEKALSSIRGGASIVTDTKMARAGINAGRLAFFGGSIHCFISDEDVAERARFEKTTRSAVSMEKALGLVDTPLIFAIGNAPTALIRLSALIREGRLSPDLIVAAAVGFVNVVEAKEMVMALDVPYIVTRGRKGGSNIAAAICNALIYMC